MFRLVTAIRFEQELADAYFPSSGSRQGLSKAVMTSLIEPTVKAIVETGELHMHTPWQGEREHTFTGVWGKAALVVAMLFEEMHYSANVAGAVSAQAALAT